MNANKDIHFIINPISGTGKQKNIAEKIETEITAHGFHTQIHYTKATGDATAIAEKLCDKTPKIIVAVGGDGTINEVGKALVGTNHIFGMIPTGSGNGLARHLNVPQNVRKALELLRQGSIQKIDSCTLNDEFFINIAGLGFDAHIAHAFSNSQKRGIKTYVKLILKQWSSYPLKDYEISVDNKLVFEGKAFLVSFANGSQYGNNAYISPTSSMYDGKVEICILKPFSLREIPNMLMKLMSRKIHLSKHMEVLSCSEAQISTKDLCAHLDGEPVHMSNDIKLKIYPNSINMICGS